MIKHAYHVEKTEKGGSSKSTDAMMQFKIQFLRYSS